MNFYEKKTINYGFKLKNYKGKVKRVKVQEKEKAQCVVICILATSKGSQKMISKNKC